MRSICHCRRFSLRVRPSVRQFVCAIAWLDILVAFICYSATGHELEVAKVFSTLQLFNAVAIPVCELPKIFADLRDTYMGISKYSFCASEVGSVARKNRGIAAGEFLGTRKLRMTFEAEEALSDLEIDPTASLAVRLRGDYQYDGTAEPSTSDVFPTNRTRRWLKTKGGGKNHSDTTDSDHNEKESLSEPPLALRDLNLDVRKGSSRARISQRSK